MRFIPYHVFKKKGEISNASGPIKSSITLHDRIGCRLFCDKSKAINSKYKKKYPILLFCCDFLFIKYNNKM